MIHSKKDYEFYLNADKLSLQIIKKKPALLFGDVIWKFQRKLRKCEYWNNCKKNKSIIHTIYYYYQIIGLHRQSIKLGFTIPLNVFGPGLSIVHRGTIVVSDSAQIGKNCRIHICVNIGQQDGLAPRIGDNVYIGPGAKIFGGIVIADGIAIGANSVVNKSFIQPSISIAGVPAIKISDKGSLRYVIKGADIIQLKDKSI